MDFKINGENKELNFGVKFAAILDESEKYQKEGIEFGMGLMLSEEKLSMGSIGTLATIVKSALHRENVTLNEVYDALDEYAENDELESLFEKIEEELKNSSAVRLSRKVRERVSKEANRKKGVAQKPTKK